ncbi:MAG: hypothetical protein C0456_14270 [Hyphomonas sp.]|jgi:hypothetical protein|uniref:Uncharacterized protein n=1 Tax=Hyphomonas polymorpha PS728 TaxID=1280954 RepID=A0A062VDH8_9PROT|nr:MULTISPECIES: hypothetical protein [Hyphomonas]AXE65697.1 hypothetical protein BBF93_16770 [Hyphomonas sp. CACIAM 19H1]KCZ97477.1 hypothetical protein HPO_14896 [Hyphomonas polymorpha PS728]MBA4227789.1 hypothetical protein [Hyphomonas sp.]OZB19208.1 MAG: hypothetical protein B7X53_00685 [Hyphomonas sp. 34-62-18]
MKQGHLVHNNWLLGGLAVAILAATVILSSIAGNMSLEVAGLSVNLERHENGGVRVFFVQAP